MLNFKNITLSDRDRITSYTLNSNRRNCDLSFSNLCCWRFLYDTQFAEMDGFIVFKFWAHGQLAYMMPVGQGDLKKVVNKMIEDAEKEGEPLVMLGVSSEMREELEEIMPKTFAYTIDRDYADYIYLKENLAELKGRKFQQKRNHVNRFIKAYDNHKFVPITTPEHIKECLHFEAEWCKQNECDKHEGTGNEREAIIYGLNNFDELGLKGGILYAEDKVVAFTYGMPINADTFGTHVEKADATVEGAYAMINREFARYIPEQYTYINREEDLGIPGLRRAKLSYNPTIILDKHMVSLQTDAVDELDW